MVEQVDSHENEGFSAEWLALREPADHTARSRTLDQQLGLWARQHRSLRILECGAGSGSNLRYLLPLLGQQQHWTVLDHDAKLLAALRDTLQHWAVINRVVFQEHQHGISLRGEQFQASIHCQQQDLAAELDNLPFSSSDLVTGSALLDLTSQHWLDALAQRCIDESCASLFVLNYNGQMAWQPEHSADALMQQLLNAHQLNNKGFGPAMGPQAGQYFAAQLRRGQTVFEENSPWKLTTDQQALQSALIQGWSTAAIEQSITDATTIKHWLTERQHQNDKAKSRLTVGHTDILALPTA